MSFRANCFKCKKNFDSTDPEDETNEFFCPSCQKVSKIIAQEIDERLKNRPKSKEIPKMQPFQKSNDGKIEIYNARQFM